MYTNCPYCSKRINLRILRGRPDLSPLADHIDQCHPDKGSRASHGAQCRSLPYTAILFDD